MTTDGNESTCMLIIVTLFTSMFSSIYIYICFQVCLFTRDRGLLLGYNIYINIYIYINTCIY